MSGRLEEEPSEMTASYSEICEEEDEEEVVRPTTLDFLSQLEGTVTKHGDLITFVADDLETKIKLSSPSRDEDDVGSVPGLLVAEIEAEALRVAASVDSLTENLSEILHGISALTVDCLEVYRDVVCKTCDAVDLNIKSMYQLVAKSEELNKLMAPIYGLAAHVKNIKHLLDLLEAS